MSAPSEARSSATGTLVELPVDLVELELRLLAVERRLREQQRGDQLLLGAAEALRQLNEALYPLLEGARPVVESGGARSEASPHEPFPASPPPVVPAPPPPGPLSVAPPAPPPAAPSAATPPAAPTPAVEPERLAVAHARMREAATEAPQPPPAQRAPEPPPAQRAPEAPPAPHAPEARPAPYAPQAAAAPRAPSPAPARRSWLLRALRRMVARDPEAAGRLLVALLPASGLAQIEPLERLPGPPATVARVVVRRRLRRRLGWEMAQLACDLTTVSELAKLVRLRAAPAQLHAAGVRLDPSLVLSLVALAIDPLWTLGHRFTLAHLDAKAAYLEVRDGARPAVNMERPAGAVTTTVRCSDDALLPLLAGEPGVVSTVEGERRPLELVRGWFADASTAQSGLRP